ncbi:MAG: hypothetical protein U0905_19085 [Pirellulales bacterium]
MAIKPSIRYSVDPKAIASHVPSDIREYVKLVRLTHPFYTVICYSGDSQQFTFESIAEIDRTSS